MTYTIDVFTVLDSWWWTEKLFETCRVLFQNKFDNLVHLVGFIIRNLSRCTVTWTSNPCSSVLVCPLYLSSERHHEHEGSGNKYIIRNVILCIHHRHHQRTALRYVIRVCSICMAVCRSECIVALTWGYVCRPFYINVVYTYIYN